VTVPTTVAHALADAELDALLDDTLSAELAPYLDSVDPEHNRESSQRQRRNGIRPGGSGCSA
jgi:hypothetical protein